MQLTEVPRDSLMGALRGLDNTVSFQKERYVANPLTIIGPWSGTASHGAGVLSDPDVGTGNGGLKKNSSCGKIRHGFGDKPAS